MCLERSKDHINSLTPGAFVGGRQVHQAAIARQRSGFFSDSLTLLLQLVYQWFCQFVSLPYKDTLRACRLWQDSAYFSLSLDISPETLGVEAVQVNRLS